MKWRGDKIFEMKVVCPRCGNILTAVQGSPDVECNCHLYCEDGTKPSDCSMTAQEWSGDHGWPTGLHVGADNNSDDIKNVAYYCSTHSKYSFKSKVVIPLDWDSWFSKRAPKKLRMSHGNY